MNFLSDNAYGAWPEIIQAVAAAAEGPAPSYGADGLTSQIEARLERVFAHRVMTFPVISGTAANALALATLCPPHGAVFCHAEAHINVDECGAPEFFCHGAKLIGVEGEHGKITPASLATALSHQIKDFVHHAQPAVLSLTQSTEVGTVYTPDEIAAISRIAHGNGMKVHMDGARFANALAHLDVTPAAATWQAGVDVVSFGATKNGALAAEAVVFFDPADVKDFEYRRKKGGHLVSKMRFVSAQLAAYLDDGRWLTRAAHANRLATRLAAGLEEIKGAEIAHPVEANAVFVWLPDALAAHLREGGAEFYDWGPPVNGRTLIRLVTSFATPDADVERFVALARGG
jgi:threonine aldolase